MFEAFIETFSKPTFIVPDDEKIEEYIQQGYQKGVYQSSLILGNSFTIIVTSIWFGFVFYRTVIYFLYFSVCPLLNVEKKSRNCGCGLGKQCESWSPEDLSLRDRGTRIISCVHVSGYVFAWVLFGTIFFDYYKESRYCLIQAVFEQVCIWFQMLQFYIFFSWLFVDHFFCTKLDEDEKDIPIARFRSEMDEGSDENDPIYTDKSDTRANVNEEIIVDDVEEVDEEEIFLRSMEHQYGFGADKKRSFKISRMYQQDDFCACSLLLCGLEIAGFCISMFVTVLAVIIPLLMGMFDPESQSLRPRWCWITNFKEQVYLFYLELFFGMGIIVPLSIVMWLRFCAYNHHLCSYLFCCRSRTSVSLTNDPKVRIIGIKVILYSIVFLGWIISFSHRLALYLHDGVEDTPWLAILGALQEFQMGSYTGFMVMAFFATTLITSYCPGLVDLGICDFGDRIRKWCNGRHEWLGKQNWRNEKLEYYEAVSFCPTVTSATSLIIKEFRNDVK